MDPLTDDVNSDQTSHNIKITVAARVFRPRSTAVILFVFQKPETEIDGTK